MASHNAAIFLSSSEVRRVASAPPKIPSHAQTFNTTLQAARVNQPPETQEHLERLAWQP
jgi:hypothetical protein